MPTNVTAEYKQAEQAFREAREPRERLERLKEMLRTVPKHKGTEHLQADIKSRIKQLTDELSGPKKGGRKGPSYTVRSEGAAQISLIGPPNAGKSSLHARLTGSRTEIAPYPCTTRLPVPGMLAYEDIHFQLVDLPPLSAEFMEPWFTTAIQHADAACLVVDLSDPETPEHVIAIREQLAAKHIVLSERWPGIDGDRSSGTETTAAETEIGDPFRVELPTVLVANKRDLDPEPDEVRVLEEILGLRFPALSVSAVTGYGLSALSPLLFEALEVVRVYTKAPGRPPDTARPFTVRRGATVSDVARQVHGDIARTLKFARLWGSSQFAGQQVGPDHPVADGDIIELHSQ